MLVCLQSSQAGVVQKNSVILIALTVLLAGLFSNSAVAGDLEWSGVYRFEGNFLKNSELDGDREITYGQHHLVLRPKITAGDGLTIYGQFDLMNSSAYPNSQMGQIWGSGPGTPAAGEPAANSNSASQAQKAESIEITQLYLTYTQEYGSLLVGRAPLQFGLGMTHNAGRGLFDHWYDTRDMAAYKFVVGNLFFMPMFGKASEKNLQQPDDVNDYMFQFQYENPETDLELGVFYQWRKSNNQGSDTPGGTPLGGATNAGPIAKVDNRTVSVYALRNSENLRLGLEAAFQSGETGVQTAGGDNVAFGGFGVAGEFEYRPQDSKWRWGLKAGSASGDDPGTDAKFEGFIFDRNYQVAMLMFHRPLGQNDFLRTQFQTGTVRGADGRINKADVEAISNVIYLAPNAHYSFNDRWSVDQAIATGWLTEQPIAGRDGGKDLGYEYDISLNWAPRKGVMWVNQVGVLFPGSAWESDGQYNSKMAFGLATKAAISF